MKKKLLIEVGDDIDLDFIRKNCKTGGPIISPMPEFRAIADGKVLSDMTNGDMMKAMFPDLQVVDVGIHRIVVIFGDCHNMMYRNSYDEDWWNAPYNGSEE